MFEVGFSELVLVAIVALLVLGPERLPKMARLAGMWVGRARRSLASVKQEIDRELKAEELNRILDEQARANPLETILEDSWKAPADPQSTPPKAPDTPFPPDAGLPSDRGPRHSGHP